MSLSKSAEVRSRLDHPVIDADGHWAELYPVYFDYLREVAGAATLETFRSILNTRYKGWYEATPDERLRKRMRRPAYWGYPTNLIDRAASLIPSLFRERLDEWGIDVSIVFPSLGFTLGRDVTDPDMATDIIKAYNVMAADLFKPHSDRVIPVGVVNLYEPNTAIEQLEHAHSVGLKLVMMGGSLPRTMEEDAKWQPDPQKRRVYVDGLGLDSAYDYDPVWQKFVDLKMPVCTHVGSMGWPDRSSPTNFVANHIGHFAQSHHLFARSLFLGGVTQRFPTLNFAFLEGGVGWACSLLADMHGHWEKRNRKFLDERLKPTNVDLNELKKLFEQYTSGHKRFEGKIDEIINTSLDIEYNMSQEELARRDLDSDDFLHVNIQSEEDIDRLFAKNFYFGCEADDPMTAVAFDEKLGLKLKTLLGSDISHFDVVDATEVVEEAWEMVEDGLITEDNFREFAYTNAVQLFRGMNPDFFKGTVIERDVEGEYRAARDRDAALGW